MLRSQQLVASGGRTRIRFNGEAATANLIEMADLTHHPPRLRSDATVIVGCRRDGYILASEILRLTADHQYFIF
jgi:hypothetical protein